ncbi:MAG: PorP/SprF family type IX secretion system membrane protein [Crocinitomicaceae bacterium]|nr:PorP/SprF family type IX secretion system membrane protein [Crocinitomicaceae bacterium]
MKRKLLVLSLIACAISGNATAQQDRAMTHFMYEKMSVNPGATGINFIDGFCGTSIYRNQWDKVNGAPNSAVLNVEGNIDRWVANSGVGIAFYHDAIAFTRQNTAVINYSYHIPISGLGQLGVGVGIGITSLGMNPDWAPPQTLVDPSLPAAFSQTKFDANFGLYLKANAGYYIGLSSTHIPGPRFTDSLVNLSAPTGLTSARHYYLMGGHTIQNISQPGDDLEMNLFVRTDLIKTSFDLNARYFWQNKLYGGLTYRMSDAIGIMAGANIFELMDGPTPPRAPQLTVGYSYDISVHKLSSISTGSHEMFVKFCYFLPPIPISKSKHPRWL